MSVSLKDISISDIGLSVRSTNGLLKSGIETVEAMLGLDEEGLYKMPNLGKKSVEEILEKIHYFQEMDPDYVKPVRPGVFGLIDEPENRETILEYVRNNDEDIDNLGLSNRSRNQLVKNGYLKMSDVVFLTEAELKTIPALGGNSVNEIVTVINDYLKKNEDRVIAFLSGDQTAIADDRNIREEIVDLFKNIGFKGLSLSEICDKLDLPEAVTEERIKLNIGKLLNDGILEYVDFRCYRVYPKFIDMMEVTPKISDRNKTLLKKRLEGITLEIIGQEETPSLTRERVRQIVTKEAAKVADYSRRTTGLPFFDEDYYRYFYNTYAFDKKECSQWLGVSPYVWNYLDTIGVKRGEKSLEEAQEDYTNLDLGFRLKIKNYLNRNKLFLDGEWVNKRRDALEEYVIRKLCQNEVTFTEFVDIYNDFLKSEEVEFDPDLYITEDVYATRKNRLMDLTCLLWKQNEKLRYYDIEGRDFTELFDTLNLSSYENIEISTSKMMWENPEVMRKYDIRDQYELHNLLRKVLKEGDYHEFHCNRMPNIAFGKFNRDEAILQILIDNSPISTEGIIDIIHEEYGYDKGTILGTYLIPISKYYYDGIYSIDQKIAPDYQLDLLKRKLTENFYFFDEIRNIYKDLFKDADPEAINPYTIKKMGFNAYSRYALKGYNSLESYFNDFLTKDDIVDLHPLRKRYAYVVTFSNKLMELKRGLQVIEFEPNILINIRKLEKAGVSKEAIRKYCDAVYEFVEDGEFFSSRSIINDGFDSELFDLGFSDWFYGSILISDSRFTYGNMFGNLIFKKGEGQITVKDFAYDVIRQNEVIDRYDLISELNEHYGCSVKDIWDVYYKVQDTGIHFDRFLDRIYLNEDIYYEELENAGEL